MLPSITTVGRTDKSRFKHHFFASVLHALDVLGKCRSHKRPALLDLNGGDGYGTPLSGSFSVSPSTAETMVQIAWRYSVTDVLLFERKKVLEQLRRRFDNNPQCIILPNNRLAYQHVDDYDYVLAVSDPNGPSEHAKAFHLNMLCQYAPADCDIVLFYNEGVVEHNLVEKKWNSDVKSVLKANETNNGRYPKMRESDYFAKALGMPYLVRSVRFDASAQFRFRLMVLSRTPLNDFVKSWNDKCRRWEELGAPSVRGRYRTSSGFQKWWDDPDFSQFSKRFEVIQ